PSSSARTPTASGTCTPRTCAPTSPRRCRPASSPTPTPSGPGCTCRWATATSTCPRSSPTSRASATTAGGYSSRTRSSPASPTARARSPTSGAAWPTCARSRPRRATAPAGSVPDGRSCACAALSERGLDEGPRGLARGLGGLGVAGDGRRRLRTLGEDRRLGAGAGGPAGLGDQPVDVALEGRLVLADRLGDPLARGAELAEGVDEPAAAEVPLGEPLGEEVVDRQQPLPRVRGAGDRAVDAVGPHGVPVREHREHEVLLGGELAVDRLERDAGLVAHRVHADLADAAAVEQPVGCGHDPLASVLGRHGVHPLSVGRRENFRSPGGRRVVPQALTKSSRAWLTSSACVQSRPWGASSISTYVASGTSSWNRRPVASIGKMLSFVPCRISVGRPASR